MDWTKEDNPFEDITVPDELTEFVILCENFFSEEAGQIWLEKNEWCKKNYNLMRDTQNIMDELIKEGHKVNEFSFYKELDNRLGALKPDIFKDKEIQTSKDVVSVEDIYDDNHQWRVIPDFTVAINLENQNPVFELFDCTDLVDISPLEQLPHLRELILHYCSKLEDTFPIGKLVNLAFAAPDLEFIDDYGFISPDYFETNINEFLLDTTKVGWIAAEDERYVVPLVTFYDTSNRPRTFQTSNYLGVTSYLTFTFDTGGLSRKKRVEIIP